MVEINHEAANRILARVNEDQVQRLAELMATAAIYWDRLEELFRRARILLDEEAIEDVNDTWAHDAIFNCYTVVSADTADADWPEILR